MTDAYGACPIKRFRRSKADIDAVRSAIVEVLTADHPMIIRQVFYQLVARGVIEKTEAQYQGTVIRLLTDMRMSGEIDFSWIVDDSRAGQQLRSFDNVADALEDCAKYYRCNAMRECPDYVEIWVEKQGLAGLLWEEVGGYGVPIMASKGMPSLSMLWQTACLVKKAARAGKRSFIYQFGDHDPTGVLIPHTIKRRLCELCAKLDCSPPVTERVSLTIEQIEQFNLPTRPTKRDGNSHAKAFEGESVEIDALPPAELRRLVRGCAIRHIDIRLWSVLQASEASERQALWDLADSAREAAQ